MQHQTDIAELERRITSALERIGAGLDAFAAPAQTAASAPDASADIDADTASPGAVKLGPDTAKDAPATSAVPEASVKPSEQTIAANRRLQARILTLQTELEETKAANAKLAETLKAAEERALKHQPQGQADEKIEKMTRQLDVQGLELQRMRKSTVQLREHLRVLHEAAAAQMAEPQMVNKAMLAELESLRATRHSETAEMDEILAELMPLILEARSNG